MARENRELNEDWNLERKEKFHKKTIIEISTEELEKVIEMSPKEENDYWNKLTSD